MVKTPETQKALSNSTIVLQNQQVAVFMLVLYTDILREAWRLNIIWAAPQSKLNLEVRRKSAYLRASGNRKGYISGWLIYLSIYFTINFGVKVSPWEKWGRQQMFSGERCMKNYCAYGSTVHFRGSTSKTGRGESAAWDWEEIIFKKLDIWMVHRQKKRTTVPVDRPLIALIREAALEI